MAYEEKKAHSVLLENRARLAVSGVEDVESFDENLINMAIGDGALVIRGSGLHIEKLSLDGGDMLVTGFVDSLSYEDRGSRQGSLLSRLFHP